MDAPTPSGQTKPWDNRPRLIAWLVLGLPLAIYAAVWPVRARLDLGVIERHLAGAIWRRMSESLPGMNPQWLIEAAFWIGVLAFMAGALYLVWLALEGAGDEPQPSESPVVAPDDSAIIVD